MPTAAAARVATLKVVEGDLGAAVVAGGHAANAVGLLLHLSVVQQKFDLVSVLSGDVNVSVLHAVPAVTHPPSTFTPLGEKVVYLLKQWVIPAGHGVIIGVAG